MKRWFFFYFITLFSTINGSELFIFNVGQGNCNLFIPDQNYLELVGLGFRYYMMLEALEEDLEMQVM